MLNLLSALLFTLSSNLDGVVVGIAYGIKKIKIGLISTLFISLITVLGTWLSMLAGKGLATAISPETANLIGGGAIILLGVYMLVESIINMVSNNKDVKIIALKDTDNMLDYAQKSDKDISGYIEPRETLAVGIGLTLNNIGAGIAASVAGVGIWETVIFTFVFSLAFIQIGIHLGSRITGSFLGKYAPLISGIMLMILGVIECIY